ncbi:MAG: 6-phosphofructokinase [Clostridia bacterium]|nr:6-phosphofructokinase [Clostridia bacterium]
MKIGLLTSGGDAPGLNAVMRAFAKHVYAQAKDVKIIGFANGYTGLIEGDYQELEEEDFDDLLMMGGTVLGSKRQPFKLMTVREGNNKTKLEKMKETYEKLGLDCLITLGGAGTHKTAALLASEGCNVIGLPKTIDNDIWGTELTFGFNTAMQRATECIDCMHSTAASHSRTMLVEIMGNKVGWLTLYAGLAGGADMILIPEIPYDEEAVVDFLEKRKKSGEKYSIVAIAEGAMSVEESKLKKKEMLALRAEKGESTATNRLAKYIQEKTGVETRAQVVGYLQRGGSPNPYDRAICSLMGSYAASLALDGKFGVTVAYSSGKVTYNSLADIAGKAKSVPKDHQLIQAAKAMGVSFGTRD